MKGFFEKVTKQWSAFLVIVAIFTMGMNYANSMSKLNEQIISLTNTVSDLSNSVKEITNITSRVESLERELTGMKIEDSNRLKTTARLILITLSAPEKLDGLPASKMILKEACDNSQIRTQLYEDVGADKTMKFCAYVNR